MKKILIILVCAIGFIGLVACTEKEEVSLSFEEISKKPWEEIVALAQEEGEVSWYVWYFQNQFREIAQDFEQEYGISVTIPEGTHEGNLNKAIAEKIKEVGSIDLISLGSDRFDALQYAGPITFIPESEDRKNTVGGVDLKGYGFAYWGNQTGIAYDQKRITEDQLPQSFEDFEQWLAENPKLMGVNDPSGGGAGQSFIREVVRNTDPQYNKYVSGVALEETPDLTQSWEWFKKNKDNIVITASNADSLTRLNDGEFILVPAWEDHLANLQRQGSVGRDIKFYIPEMGMAGGGNFVAIMPNAPHKAASIVFIHWLTSPKVQTRFNETFGAAPQNSKADASNALVPQEMRENSLNVFSGEYETEIKKQFLENVLIGGGL